MTTKYKSKIVVKALDQNGNWWEIDPECEAVTPNSIFKGKSVKQIYKMISDSIKKGDKNAFVRVHIEKNIRIDKTEVLKEFKKEDVITIPNYKAKYIKHPTQNSYMTIVSTYKDNYVDFALSFSSTKDHFSKKSGREVALKRLMSGNKYMAQVEPDKKPGDAIARVYNDISYKDAFPYIWRNSKLVNIPQTHGLSVVIRAY